MGTWELDAPFSGGPAWETTPWRETPLARYVDRRIYDIDRGYRTEAEKTTKPWFVWKPPERSSGEPLKEVLFADKLGEWLYHIPEENRLHYPPEDYPPPEKKRPLKPWEPFLLAGDIERFEPDFTASGYYFGSWEERRKQLFDTVRQFAEQFEIDLNGSFPSSLIDRLQSIRDEAKERLQFHGSRLQEFVMRPLRNVLIPCAIEGARSNGGLFTPRVSMKEETRKKRYEMASDIESVWRSIGRGKSMLSESGDHLARLKHVPEPVAEGAKAAIRVYVESNESNSLRPSTRDEILERARPVYFKYRAACIMLTAVLYNRNLNEVIRDMKEEARDQRGEEAPISGYYGAEYAIKAQEVVNNKPVTTFSQLKREMGDSRVDTVKRNIGYDDLPREKKEEGGFTLFCEMLTDKVEQQKGG